MTDSSDPNPSPNVQTTFASAELDASKLTSKGVQPLITSEEAVIAGAGSTSIFVFKTLLQCSDEISRLTLNSPGEL